MTIENKPFLVDFGTGVVTALEYHEPPSADGLLENQIIIDGFSVEDVLDQVMYILAENKGNEERIEMVGRIIAMTQPTLSVSRN